jgi:hypothetical protein
MRRRKAGRNHPTGVVENPGREFTEISLERLMCFLTALGYHIEIKIGAGREKKTGEVTVTDTRRTAA